MIRGENAMMITNGDANVTRSSHDIGQGRGVGADDQSHGASCSPSREADQARQDVQSDRTYSPRRTAKWVDAKSIVKVMALKLPGNTSLAISAEGDDAETAVIALVALVERNFDEDRDTTTR